MQTLGKDLKSEQVSLIFGQNWFVLEHDKSWLSLKPHSSFDKRRNFFVGSNLFRIQYLLTVWLIMFWPTRCYLKPCCYVYLVLSHVCLKLHWLVLFNIRFSASILHYYNSCSLERGIHLNIGHGKELVFDNRIYLAPKDYSQCFDIFSCHIEYIVFYILTSK